MEKIIALLYCCLLLSTCRSDEAPSQEKQESTAVQEHVYPGPAITNIGFSREDTVLHYTMNIKYPAIREHEVFNAAIRSNLEKAINEFTGFIQDFNGEGRVMRSEYQVIQNTSELTSIQQIYEWAVPGTSTLQYRFGNVNYNPESKELISLESLFQKGVEHQPLLKKRLAEKIKSRFKLNVEVTNDDLQSFTIGPDDLEFYKVLYPEVMDPAPQVLQLKFSELEDKLR